MQHAGVAAAFVMCVGFVPPTVASAQRQALEPEHVAAAAEAPLSATVGFSLAEREAIAQRRLLAPVHRWLGIGTWLATTATVALGYVQYRDEYGLFADESQTPCALGRALIPSGCQGTPWPHTAAALTAGALYGATATLSLLLPDVPDEARHPNLTLHEVLRWIHLGGFVVLPILGAVTSNVVDDFGLRQALATWHLIGGTLTWGTLTWAGALML